MPALRRSARLSVGTRLSISSPSGAAKGQEAARDAARPSAVFEFGVDEAGRGPLAGPVVGAACFLPEGVTVEGVKDSKMIKTEAQREEVYARLIATPGVKWSVAIRDAEAIDSVNILQASLATMREASYELCGLEKDDDEDDGAEEDYPGKFLALVDGNQHPWKKRRGLAKRLGMTARTEIKGDGRIPCISAASVIAKVTRDRIMLKAHERYPQYNFAKHKGYGVKAHMEAIATHGYCELHRKSFEPIKSLYASGQLAAGAQGSSSNDDETSKPAVAKKATTRKSAASSKAAENPKKKKTKK